MRPSGRGLSRWGAVLALAVVLFSQVALAAQATVLRIEGDRKGRLQAQLTKSLRASRQVKVLPYRKYVAVARKERLRGRALAEPKSISLVAQALEVDAVLTGEVRRGSFQARVLSGEGKALWSGEYKLKRGRLWPKDVRALTTALVTEAKSASRFLPQLPEASAQEAEVSPAPESDSTPPKKKKKKARKKARKKAVAAE